MALTYDEFKKIVPKETLDFFSVLLPLLNRYLSHGSDLYFNGTNYSADDNGSISFYLSVYALNSLKEYMAFLGESGFKKNAYKIDEPNVNNIPPLDFLYEKYNYLIPQYEDKTLYYGLQPLDIIIDLQTKHGSSLNSYIFTTVFTQCTMTNFRKKLQSAIDAKQQAREKLIEKEIYDQVPISVISYIETASRIRTLLYNKLNYNKDSICKLIDEDIVPLSLFLALFINIGKNNDQTKNNFNNREAIMCLFLEKGIDFNKIKNILNISFDEEMVNNSDKKIYAIKELYRQYFNLDNDNNMNINMTQSKVSVQSIVKSMLDRSFTNSLVIEKLLSRFNCNVEMFKNIDQETMRALENRKKTLEQETIKNFYKDVPKKTRDFIELAGKIYTVLLEKMSKKTHNDKILATNNDAAVLALLLASSYTNGKISTFFKNSGATHEKILKLLKIDITKEEIEKVQVDRNTLVEKYKKYVYEGENNGKSSNSISIDDICFNMCKRDFNQSMILENIYNTLIPEIELTNNFLELMKEYFIKKEQLERIERTQKVFYDIPVESIKIIENASLIYPKLLKSKKNLDKRGATSISILLSILSSDNEDTKDFLTELGFDKKEICNYFDIDSRYLLYGEPDINIIEKEYGLLIFGLANQGKKREELTPFNLIRNMFTKEYNKSNVAFNKFLDQFCLSYDSFKNIDNLYKEYISAKERKLLLTKVNNDLNNYPSETIRYIKNVLCIHEKLKEKEEENLNRDSSIETIALLLGVYTTDSKVQETLKRNGLSKDIVLSTLKLPDDFLDNLDKVKIDFNTYQEKYKKYLKLDLKESSTYIYNVFKNVFKDNSTIENIISRNNINYERVRREIETGKVYEDTLTVDDRITSLEEVEVLPLQENMKDILEYGTSLIPHSTYIHDKLPKMLENYSDDSITQMTTIIDELYVPTTQSDKKAGLFTRMFNADEVRYTIDKNKLYSLERLIDRTLETLKQELLGYDEIRRYIEVYSKKNREHHKQTETMISTVEEKLDKLDSNDEEEYSTYLTTTSLLHILNDKANRFSTINILMKKELLRVNLAIVNHFITINSLEMAKNDLIPLIESEIAISQGRKTENKALDLSKNVMSLFQALLTRNVDTAIENMDKLQKTCIPDDVAVSINQDINTYMQGINQIRLIEGKINDSSKGKVLEKKQTKKD